jgi:hypothetical protein
MASLSIPALHIHERVSTQAILKIAARKDVTRDLFADPQFDYHQAVQFYRHEMDWSNRLILGDSLQVMASLAQREDLAGNVIYLDPPYGIKFASNFQPEPRAPPRCSRRPFIRDLNNAILEHPYDEGLKQLAGNFAGVLKPIIETVDRRGLKKRFLGKFRNSIDQFNKRLADDGAGEAAGKLVDRLQRNRNKMFTFLDFDDVPWNNNNAEHAVISALGRGCVKMPVEL